MNTGKQADEAVRFNLNYEVIIYPNDSGFAKIKALLSNRYLLSEEEAEDWVSKRKTEDGGYKEQLWVIVSELHDMFYNGQRYMATTDITLLNEAQWLAGCCQAWNLKKNDIQ
jgi:hypothetical protein